MVGTSDSAENFDTSQKDEELLWFWLKKVKKAGKMRLTIFLYGCPLTEFMCVCVCHRSFQSLEFGIMF